MGLIDDFRKRRRLWTAGRAPVIPARAAAIGAVVKVVGRIEPYARTIVSPFTRVACVGYEATVEEKSTTHVISVLGTRMSTEDSTPYFRTSFVLTERAPFWVVDDAGERMLVGHGDALIDYVVADVSESPAVNDEHPEVVELLRRNGVPSYMQMGRAGDHRFLEAHLPARVRVAVYGRVTEDPNGDDSRALRGTKNEPLVITLNA